MKLSPVNDHCGNADDPNVMPRAMEGCIAATEQDGVRSGGNLGRPRVRESPARPPCRALTFCSVFQLNSSLFVSRSTLPPGRKLGHFFSRQIHVGWKCKLMIWSFNHSGANPDAEEFPADSGSSDFTNPRQQPLKPLLLLHQQPSCPLDGRSTGPSSQLVPQVRFQKSAEALFVFPFELAALRIPAK